MSSAQDMLDPFEFHGVDFSEKRVGDQAVGVCPFCDKEDHFYVNVNDGRWDCKVCGKAGNTITFLEEIINLYEKEYPTTQEQWDLLQKERGIPAEYLRSLGIIKEPFSEYWLLPARHWGSGRIHNIYRWKPGSKWYSTTGCGLLPVGMGLLNDKSRKDEPVYLCAGAWDTAAMQWLLVKAGQKGICISMPGEGTFKKEWADQFARRKVVILYDNDDAGRKGTERAGEMMAGVVGSLERIEWPAEEFPEGFDVRDFVTRIQEGKFPEAFDALASLFTTMEVSTPRRRGGERRLLTVAEILAQPKPEWLVESILLERRIGMMFGPSESLKSFIALDMLLSIAAGLPFLEKFPVKKGPTVYITPEGDGGELMQRLTAYMKQRGIRPDAIGDFYGCVDAFNFLKSGEVDAAIDIIQTLCPSPVLIGIDTLAANIIGSDSKTEDMSAFTNSVRELGRHFGCGNMVVHHTGLDESRARGSTVLKGTWDTEIKIVRPRLQMVAVECTKMRGAKHFQTFNAKAVFRGESFAMTYDDGLPCASRGLSTSDLTKILEFVPSKRENALTAGDIFREFVNVDLSLKRTTFLFRLNRAVDEFGLVFRTSRRPNKYWLTDKGAESVKLSKSENPVDNCADKETGQRVVSQLPPSLKGGIVDNVPDPERSVHKKKTGKTKAGKSFGKYPDRPNNNGHGTAGHVRRIGTL